MKKYAVAALAALALTAAPASAADLIAKAKPAAAPPAPAWDVAFGGVVMSDYNFRGVSQSNKGPSAGAYAEGQLTVPFGTLYAGLAGVAIDWPSCTAATCPPGYGFTNPSAEIDITGGWRNTWGKFSLDLGFIYYYYPKETFNGATSDSDFWEIYAKAAYAITPDLTVGASIFYTPDLLNYSETFAASSISADAGAVYAALNAKWVLPWKHGDLGAFISGELGHWWIDDTGFIALGFTDPSYTYWNVGLAFTYKVFTLDLRYHGTDMSKADCGAFLLTGVPNRSNNWCDDTFIAALKFDTTLSALK
jgi:uncharacterized protein (TIGR02001 family)